MDPKKYAQASTSREANRPDESENRYRRIFETAQDGILILEADTGQITDVNPWVIRCNIRDITERKLAHETGGVELHIRDNGSGFDPGQPPPAGHFGLSMLHARVEAVGAVLKIISQPGHGTDTAICWKVAPHKETETP